MAVSLSKGGNVSLTKTAPGLERVLVGLGWDARASDGSAFDLDASVFLCGESGKVRSDSDFIFYNNLRSTDGSVEHTGDNRTGAGDGDDESIRVELTRVPAYVHKIVFAVTIQDAETRRQNFGMVSRALVRVINQDNNDEIARYELSEDSSMETAMTFAELYRHNSEWKFRAIGQGTEGGLSALARQYGVNL